MDIKNSLKSWVRERKSDKLRIFSLPVSGTSKKLVLKEHINEEKITLSIYDGNNEESNIELSDKEFINQLILSLEVMKQSTYNT